MEALAFPWFVKVLPLCTSGSLKAVKAGKHDNANCYLGNGLKTLNMPFAIVFHKASYFYLPENLLFQHEAAVG